jgi:chromosome segregation ATPase
VLFQWRWNVIANMEALDTIDSDISAAQANLEEIQAQIEEKRHAVAGVNAEVEAALEKLAVVRAETTLAQLYQDQILESVQSLRRQFALLEEQWSSQECGRVCSGNNPASKTQHGARHARPAFREVDTPASA